MPLVRAVLGLPPPGAARHQQGDRDRLSFGPDPRNGQESSWAPTPPWRMKMVLSLGDVGATWCREPDQE
jgi:hypothetical protein